MNEWRKSSTRLFSIYVCLSMSDFSGPGAAQ